MEMSRDFGAAWAPRFGLVSLDAQKHFVDAIQLHASQEEHLGSLLRQSTVLTRTLPNMASDTFAGDGSNLADDQPLHFTFYNVGINNNELVADAGGNRLESQYMDDFKQGQKETSQ